MIGKTVEIIERRFVDANVRYDSKKQHPNLIGKRGVVVEFEDTAYNTDYPTGHERAYCTVNIEGVEHVIDESFVKVV